MLRRRHYIALVLVVVLTLIILNLPDQTAGRLKLAIGGLFLPLFGLANSTQQVAGKTADTLTPRADLLRENTALRREVEQLRVEAMQARETARQAERLQQLLGWQQKVPWKLKLANVVLREPANWWRTVQIDVGTRDGLRVSLPVLTSDGLVGRVASAGLTRSQVVLVGDPNCRVAVLIENESRDSGILQEAGPFDNSLLTIGYLSRGANLKPGQNVVTSGLGGIFPKGIPVGKIVDSRQVDYGLYTEARVRLAANLSGLEQVWILLP